MISSALLSIGIFPSTIPHLFGSTGTFGGHVKKYSFMFQFKIYWSYITNELFGIATSPWHTMTSVYVFYAIIIFLFLFIPFVLYSDMKNGFIHFLKNLKMDSYNF